MKNTSRKLFAVAAFVASVSPALCQAQATFDLSSSDTAAPCSGFTGGAADGNFTTCARTNTTGAATKVVVSAWSTPSAGFAFASGATLNSAELNDQGASGVGAYNQADTTGSPNHAFDSVTPGFVDMMLLNFRNASDVNTAVSLSSLKMGWTGKEVNTLSCDITPTVGTTSTQCDSDISVFRWTGNAAGPTTAGSGSSATLSATTGWTLVGSYADLTAGNAQSITGSASSSWWLISAFSSTLAGAASCTTCDNGNDAFKLNYLTTGAAVCAPGTSGTMGANGICSSSLTVPEPTTAGLLSITLIALGLMRRRPRS